MIPKGDKKIIRAWTMYDWANSVYSLTITTAVFPIYFAKVTSTPESDIVTFLGMQFTNTALYAYALSAAFLLIALASPLLSAIADYSGSKKGFMKFFCTLGGLSCCSLYFFDSSTLAIGIAGFMLATIGYSGSIVFYNSYLPEIAEPEDQDRVSARGFAMGYIGSSLLLIQNLAMIMKPEWFGIEDASLAPRISFVLVGIWWIGFAQITFRRLPSNPYQRQRSGKYLTRGYKELGKVWNQLKSQPALTRFLSGFFFYNMGVQTVMYVASLFGEKEIRMETEDLIITVLIIQFIAILGAVLFSRLSAKVGNIRALVVAILIWIGICVAAYHTYNVNQFYVLAAFVGLVMGGIQSLSRSTYSKMLPPTEDHASYFSFYDVCDKFGLVLGSLSYGIIEEMTGSMRNSIVALISYFVVGVVFLFLLLASRRKAAGVVS